MQCGIFYSDGDHMALDVISDGKEIMIRKTYIKNIGKGGEE